LATRTPCLRLTAAFAWLLCRVRRQARENISLTLDPHARAAAVPGGSRTDSLTRTAPADICTRVRLAGCADWFARFACRNSPDRRPSVTVATGPGPAGHDESRARRHRVSSVRPTSVAISTRPTTSPGLIPAGRWAAALPGGPVPSALPDPGDWVPVAAAVVAG